MSDLSKKHSKVAYCVGDVIGIVAQVGFALLIVALSMMLFRTANASEPCSDYVELVGIQDQLIDKKEAEISILRGSRAALIEDVAERDEMIRSTQREADQLADELTETTDDLEQAIQRRRSVQTRSALMVTGSAILAGISAVLLITK